MKEPNARDLSTYMYLLCRNEKEDVNQFAFIIAPLLLLLLLFFFSSLLFAQILHATHTASAFCEITSIQTPTNVHANACFLGSSFFSESPIAATSNTTVTATSPLLLWTSLNFLRAAPSEPKQKLDTSSTTRGGLTWCTTIPVNVNTGITIKIQTRAVQL